MIDVALSFAHIFGGNKLEEMDYKWRLLRNTK